MHFYIVIEDQMTAQGTFALLHDHYTDINQAYNKYFTICAAAAVSALPYHAAMMIREDGCVLEQKAWDRREQE